MINQHHQNGINNYKLITYPEQKITQYIHQPRESEFPRFPHLPRKFWPSQPSLVSALARTKIRTFYSLSQGA